MDSLKKADSILSISSITSDGVNNDDEFLKANAMLKQIVEAASEYHSENLVLKNEIVELLSILNIDTKNFAMDIKEGFQTANSILRSEGLTEVDERLLQLCLEKKRIENKMKERQDRLLKAEYNSAFAKYNNFQNKLTKVRTELEDIQELLQSKFSASENAEYNRIHLSDKLQKYKQQIKILEQELSSFQGIEVKETVHKSNYLMEKLNELSELHNSMAKYGGLPPNLLQAKNLLKYKKQELKDIATLIESKMN